MSVQKAGCTNTITRWKPTKHVLNAPFTKGSFIYVTTRRHGQKALHQVPMGWLQSRQEEGDGHMGQVHYLPCIFWHMSMLLLNPLVAGRLSYGSHPPGLRVTSNFLPDETNTPPSQASIPPFSQPLIPLILKLSPSTADILLGKFSTWRKLEGMLWQTPLPAN